MFPIRAVPKPISFDFSTPQGEPHVVQARLGHAKDIVQILEQVPVAHMDLSIMFAPEMVKRLLENHSKCTSNNKRGRRCGKALCIDSVRNLPSILEGLDSLDILTHWDHVETALKGISSCCYCAYHRLYALEDIEALGARLFRQSRDPDSSPLLIRLDQQIASKWFKSIRVSEPTMICLRKRLEQIPPKKKYHGKKNRAIKDPSTRQSHDHEFVEYQPQSQRPHTWNKVLKKLILAPITRERLRTGYVYLFWYVGTFGMLKIGVTNEVPRRLKAWMKQCGCLIEEHLQFCGYQRLSIPYARLVEVLVHAVLKEVRRKEVGCKGCKGNHIEFFRTTPGRAKFTILQIAYWLDENPVRYNSSRRAFEFSGCIDDLVNSLANTPEDFECPRAGLKPWRTVRDSKNPDITTWSASPRLRQIPNVQIRLDIPILDKLDKILEEDSGREETG